MKKLTIIAAMAAMTATPAMAQVTSPTVDLSGTVAVECTVDNIDSAIGFGTLGRRGQASVVSDTGVDVFCNQPSTVTLTSLNGGLVLDSSSISPTNETTWDASGNPGFAAGLDYTLTVPRFGTPPISTAFLPEATPVDVVVVPALNESNFRINYDTVNSTDPLIGGNYTDTLTIALTPNGV